MDIYSHLFPNGSREWVGKLDSAGSDAESATRPQPEPVGAEQGSLKLRNLLVAVEAIEPPSVASSALMPALPAPAEGA